MDINTESSHAVESVADVNKQTITNPTALLLPNVNMTNHCSSDSKDHVSARQMDHISPQAPSHIICIPGLNNIMFN